MAHFSRTLLLAIAAANFAGSVAQAAVMPGKSAGDFSSTLADALGLGGALTELTSMIADLPEASTWALMIVGLGVIGITTRRQRARPNFA